MSECIVLDMDQLVQTGCYTLYANSELIQLSKYLIFAANQY